ncbi:MAG: SCO family protein [Pseudomonadales bacterium]
MTNAKRNIQRTVIILLCVIVVIVGAMVARILRTPDSTDVAPAPSVQVNAQTLTALQESGVFVRPQAKALAAFELTDEQGQPFTNDRFEGQWSLVFLGFTHCPDICPTTLALFKQLHASGADSPLSAIQYVLLSADPERDTAEKLASYLDYFHKDFVGLTGTVADVAHLAKQLNSLFARVPLADGDYLIDHSANIMIIDPAGKYQGFIRQPHSVEQIKAAMLAITSSY